MRHQGQQWDRVTGPDLDQGKAERHKLNQAMLKDPAFIKACEQTKARPTLRQAGKYRRKIGLAYIKGKLNVKEQETTSQSK